MCVALNFVRWILDQTQSRPIEWLFSTYMNSGWVVERFIRAMCGRAHEDDLSATHLNVTGQNQWRMQTTTKAPATRRAAQEQVSIYSPDVPKASSRYR